MRKSLNRRICAIAVCAALLGAAAGIVLWPDQRLNLLVITLDTTRADRIGCYGYRTAATPILDQLAARGVLFENAYTACPVTLPSHSTMFSGLTPREHGVHHNGIGKLDSQIPTLADMLRSRGYETGAFVGAFVLNRKFGLDRGFREYDDFTGAELANNQVHRRRGGQLVVDAALAWLERRDSRPFFCWVHLFDPHAPYRPREELFGPRFTTSPYDAGIAFADQQIGRLVDYLDRHELSGRTLIVVVGDHGEGLDEHAEHEHGHMLYNSTLRVPFIISNPSRCKAGHRVTQAVSLVDLLPTLQECLGSERAENLTGRSLAAALRGESIAPRPCYAETDVPYLEHRWAPQRCLVTEEWKYIRSPRPEVYDLLRDPAELHNLAESRPESLEHLETLLAELEAGLHPRRAANVQLSPAERRSLASLGYVASHHDDEDDRARQSLPDIKDRLRYHEAVEDASRLLDENRPQEALAALEDVVAAVPDYLPARMFLGEALAKSGKLDEALQVFRALAELDPKHGEVHARLGWIHGQLGHLDEAMAELRQAVNLAPDTAEYRVSLGSTYLELNRNGQAVGIVSEAAMRDSIRRVQISKSGRFLRLPVISTERSNAISGPSKPIPTGFTCTPRSPSCWLARSNSTRRSNMHSAPFN